MGPLSRDYGKLNMMAIPLSQVISTSYEKQYRMQGTRKKEDN